MSHKKISPASPQVPKIFPVSLNFAQQTLLLWALILTPGEDFLESQMRTELSGPPETNKLPSGEQSSVHTPSLSQKWIVLMISQSGSLFEGGSVPQFNGLIMRSCSEGFEVRMRCKRLNRVGMGPLDGENWRNLVFDEVLLEGDLRACELHYKLIQTNPKFMLHISSSTTKSSKNYSKITLLTSDYLTLFILPLKRLNISNFKESLSYNFRAMNLMQSQEEEFVISKFKRYGHPITRKSLERTIQWLRENPTHSIDILLKKLSQLALDSLKHDDNLQHAIQILSLKNKNLSSYEELIEDTRRRSIYSISPYELDQNTWFAERPQKDLFEFVPEDNLKMWVGNFKRITETNKEGMKEGSIGVIYENYSSLTFEGKPKLILQNQVNQLELNIPSGFVANVLLIPGCTYIARGRQEGKNLTFTVNDFILPQPMPEEKNPLFKQKFRQMCHNISSGKETTGFTPADFAKYDCVHTPLNEQSRPTLIYGNVTINQKTMRRLQRLVSAYPQGVAALILLLSDQPQESIDFSIWIKCKVFLVPHISSQGPRLLPKLPLLKTRIPSAKVLTNPARICVQGKQLVLVNYPLIKNIYTNCLLSQETVKLAPEEMLGKVSDLIFSQGTVAIAQDIYWKQNIYFHINSETTVVINDSVAAMGYHKSKGRGGMATTGNFQRQGDFLCLMSKAKNFIQFCEEPEE